MEGCDKDFGEGVESGHGGTQNPQVFNDNAFRYMVVSPGPDPLDNSKPFVQATVFSKPHCRGKSYKLSTQMIDWSGNSQTPDSIETTGGFYSSFNKFEWPEGTIASVWLEAHTDFVTWEEEGFNGDRYTLKHHSEDNRACRSLERVPWTQNAGLYG